MWWYYHQNKKISMHLCDPSRVFILCAPAPAKWLLSGLKTHRTCPASILWIASVVEHVENGLFLTGCFAKKAHSSPSSFHPLPPYPIIQKCKESKAPGNRISNHTQVLTNHGYYISFGLASQSLEARENVLWNIGHDWTHRLQGLPVSSIPMFPYNPYIFLNIFCQAGVDPNIGVTKAETQNQFKRHTRLTLHFANASCWIWSDGRLGCLWSQQVLSSIVPSAPWCYFWEDRDRITYPMTDAWDWYIYLHFSAITDIIYIDPIPIVWDTPPTNVTLANEEVWLGYLLSCKYLLTMTAGTNVTHHLANKFIR